MSEKEFEDNLNWLVEHVKKPIIFINGAEIKHPNDTKNYQTRFIKYNKILDKFVAEHKNCYLIDMRKYVTSIENTTDRLTHYQREIYMQMAKEMFNIISSISNITINPNYHKMVVLIKNIKSIFKTIMQKTFSVINDYRFSAKYKVITILGIKIRIKIKNL
jgi:ABC-type tungstate transport system permease subunit